MPYLIPFADNAFDLVISLTTLHNLKVFDLKKTVQEIERVSKGNFYITAESFRNDREEVNMLYQLLFRRGMGMAIQRMGIYRGLQFYIF